MQCFVVAVFTGGYLISLRMQGRWVGITLPLHCLAVIYPGVKKRGLILRCVTMMICAGGAPLCLGSGVSLGCHTHTCITLVPSLPEPPECCMYAFAQLRWCFRSWIMQSRTRSPSESDLLQLCVQGGCLPASAAPHALKVKCSKAQATLWDFLQQLLINFLCLR